MVECRHDLATQDRFLIGEPDLMSYVELQEEVGRLIHGKAWPTIRVPKIVANVGAKALRQLADDDEQQTVKPWMIELANEHYPIEISKARHQLGWEPQRRLKNTLPSIIDSLQEDPLRWCRVNDVEPSTQPVSLSDDS
jgi:nucleoside-diphosphate-sugar epimerase